METLLKWASQYSTPLLLLICFGAALIYVLKLVTERAVEKEFNRQAKVLELRLQRRSEFEQQVLLDRYKLVCEFSQRISRITTDLNRHFNGQEVKGLFDRNEIVPLTKVFEDLAARQFQWPEQFHEFFIVMLS